MVARETLIAQGLVAAGLADAAGDGEVIGRLVRYAERLASVALPMGFLGPKEGPKILDRHVLESAALAPLIQSIDSLVDIGSGAGLPGIVLASILGCRTHIVESDEKRARFLEETAVILGLDVVVCPERAEVAGRRPDLRDSFDVATARALARPPVAMEYTLPFVVPGGRAIFAVGPTIEQALPSLASVSAELAGGPPELVPLQVPGAEGRAWAMIVEKLGPCPERFPRRTGVAARRPLTR